MEQRHYERLVEMDANAAQKTFLLGAHASREGFGPEIVDPYGGPRQGYEACYRRIAAASDHLKAFIATRDDAE
jgi:protein-tyrosine-phosphatase